MNEYEQLNKALKLARTIHNGQKDKAGVDYIYHPIMVALLCDTVDEKTAALLHDTIEDHGDKLSFRMLKELGFSSNVIDALKLLTHIADIPYEEYIKNIKASNNLVAINVKIADLTHNSDLTRSIDGKKPNKYDKYIWALKYLKDN